MDTELFLIFPENKKAPGQTCDFTVNAEGLDEGDIKKRIMAVMELLRMFRYERFETFYDRDNIKAFCYPHLSNRHSQFNMRYVMLNLLKGFQNWRPKSEQHGEGCVLHGTEIKSNAISEVAVRMLNRPNDSFSLVDCMALVSGCSPCVASVDDKNVEVSILGLDEREVYNWFCDNRKPERDYNWNPKHGEYGKGNWAGESRLLGSRDEAKQLVKNAIGETYRGTLFCWDAQYGHYMEYKNELNNTYHSFHLEGVNEKRIPHQVKVLIDRFQKQKS